MKNTLVGVLCLLVISLVLAFTVNAVSPSGIALLGQWDVDTGVISARAKNDAVLSDVEINNPSTVFNIVKNREMTILDVRPVFTFEAGHLPGAQSFPLESFDEDFPRLTRLVTRDTPILVYCSGFECTDSHTYAQQLRDLDFKRVSVYGGGFSQWQEMGFDIE